MFLSVCGLPTHRDLMFVKYTFIVFLPLQSLLSVQCGSNIITPSLCVGSQKADTCVCVCVDFNV